MDTQEDLNEECRILAHRLRGSIRKELRTCIRNMLGTARQHTERLQQVLHLVKRTCKETPARDSVLYHVGSASIVLKPMERACGALDMWFFLCSHAPLLNEVRALDHGHRA